jgi:hypothetical protein
MSHGVRHLTFVLGPFFTIVMTEDATIAALERKGVTGIECRCLNPKCRHWVGLHFAIIRKARRDLDLDGLTLRELAARMKCSVCGGREFKWKPDQQR